MILGAKFIESKLDESAYPTITFQVNRSSIPLISQLKEKNYTLKIDESAKGRSLNQNALLWKLIGEINKEINGSRTAENDEVIYCQILEMAGSRCEYIECLIKAVETIQKAFRVVVPIEYRLNANGSQTVVCKCYLGTSLMNTKEMNLVIDKALEYASQVGLDTDYWKGEFDGC